MASVQEFFDRAGPVLSTGIVLALLSAAGASAMAWSRLDSVGDVRWEWVTGQVADLRSQRDERDQQIHELEQRIREQETRPPRLNPALDNAVEHINTNQRTVSVLEERVKSLESRIVGIGPNGWHRNDHEEYAKRMDAQLELLSRRIEALEKRR